MRNAIALSAILAILGACKSGPKDEAKCKDAEFCPGCKTFCGPDCPKDGSGNCKACGRAPAKVQTCEQKWFWCSTHSEWHANQPCGDDASKKCCEASPVSTAVCVPRDTAGLEKAVYCPKCRCFCGTECPTDESGACKACGRKPVEVTALAGPWHWCTEHAAWHQTKTCKANDDKKCCTEVKAKILACHPE